MSMTRRLISALAVGAVAAVVASCGQNSGKADPNKVVFAVLPAESQAASEPLWAPLVTDLEEETGLDIELRFVPNYTVLVETMRAGQIQVAWMSALPALDATRRADGEIIGRIANREGETHYRSVLITQANSGITLDQVLACGRRYTFGMGDARSTSGTLAPLAFLFGPRDIEPSECFREVRPANHQANALAVANGQVDLATNNDVGLLFTRRQNPRAAANIRVLWESPPIPESAIVVRKDLDPATIEKLRSFFLTYGDTPEHKTVLEGLAYSGFQAADDSYLDPVREMEASVALMEAKRTGDQARIAQAQSAYDAVRAKVAAAGEVQP